MLKIIFPVSIFGGSTCWSCGSKAVGEQPSDLPWAMRSGTDKPIIVPTRPCRSCNRGENDAVNCASAMRSGDCQNRMRGKTKEDQDRGCECAQHLVANVDEFEDVPSVSSRLVRPLFETGPASSMSRACGY